MECTQYGDHGFRSGAERYVGWAHDGSDLERRAVITTMAQRTPSATRIAAKQLTLRTREAPTSAPRNMERADMSRRPALEPAPPASRLSADRPVMVSVS